MLSFEAMDNAHALQDLIGLGAVLANYTPRGAAAVERYILFTTITPEAQRGTPSGYSPQIKAMIVNDATDGVASVELGSDKIEIPDGLGVEAGAYPIAEKKLDGAVWILHLHVNG